MTSPYLKRPLRELVEAAREYASAKTVTTTDGRTRALTARERLNRNSRVVRLMTADAKRLCHEV